MYNKLFIYLLNVTDDVPRIAASITVDKDLTTVVSVDQKVVSKSTFNDLLTGDGVRKLSQLINIMMRVKYWTSDVSSMSLALAVDMAVNALKAVLTAWKTRTARSTDRVPDRAMTKKQGLSGLLADSDSQKHCYGSL